MDFLTTVKGSLLDGFYPKGWDMAKIDACCEKGVAREDFWHKDFNPIECENIYEFDTLMGHEIALTIKNAREKGEKLAMILPVGPMGMYKWAVYFLKEWKIKCDHVYTFNMQQPHRPLDQPRRQCYPNQLGCTVRSQLRQQREQP